MSYTSYWKQGNQPMPKQVNANKPMKLTKSESITFRVTQELKAKLDAEAERLNVTRGEIVRQKLSK
jgi:hypothetical protein